MSHAAGFEKGLYLLLQTGQHEPSTYSGLRHVTLGQDLGLHLTIPCCFTEDHKMYEYLLEYKSRIMRQRRRIGAAAGRVRLFSSFCQPRHKLRSHSAPGLIAGKKFVCGEIFDMTQSTYVTAALVAAALPNRAIRVDGIIKLAASRTFACLHVFQSGINIL
jgi:hypothetical protein